MRVSDLAREFDVLILGGGPAGAGLALALKRAGVDRVLVADRPARRPFRIVESAAPCLGVLLRRLGLDDRLESRGHRACYGNFSLWGGATLAVADFISSAGGPGWHLDREIFDAWLRAEAVSAGAQLLSPADLAAIRSDRDGWLVDLRAGGSDIEVRARWIADATGRPAAFARRSGAQLHRLDRLIALAMRTEPVSDSGFGGYSLVEAADIGWWYAARQPDGMAVVALMTDVDLAHAGDLLSPDIFRQYWGRTSQISRFVASPGAMQPAVFSAGTQFLDCAIGNRWLALGDSLMAFDPLSAAGLTGALEDAISAADTIVALLHEHEGGVGGNVRAAYAMRAGATLRRYFAEREAMYGSEVRWAGAPFWRRRTLTAPKLLQKSA